MKAVWNEKNELVDPTLVKASVLASQIALGEKPAETVEDAAKTPEAYQQLASQTSDPMTNPQPVTALGIPVETPKEDLPAGIASAEKSERPSAVPPTPKAE